MKVSVNWLKDFVNLSPPFEKAAEDLTMAGLEVKKVEPSADRKDLLVEIEITPNRPDWLSHFGVAREIAAVQNLSLKNMELPKTVSRPMPAGWKIHLKDQEACPYYTGVYIEGIQNFVTPDFIKERLAACGVRSIHIAVDITNYVLLEMGQPLHAFDSDLLAGQEIQIRKARPEEKWMAINGQSYTLSGQDLVIADSDKAVALAGIMGGKDSEVTERTRNIFLESAFFHPRFVRQSSRRFGLSSDSSYRFERRVDPEGVDLGRERAVALIQQYAKPRFISAALKAGQMPSAEKAILHLNLQEVIKRLGISLKQHQIVSILNRLGFESKPDSAESVKVHIPSFRADVTEAVDLIEEIARIYGYENIPPSLPVRAPLEISQSPLERIEDQAGHYLTASGCYETVTFSLISTHGLEIEKDLADGVFVKNPLHQELCWMRPFFYPSFCAVMQKNLSWGASSMAFFEIANLYRQQKNKPPAEERSLGIALCGKSRLKSRLDSDRNYTFCDLKGIVAGFLQRLGAEVQWALAQVSFLASPGAEEILINEKHAGYLGEIPWGRLKAWDIELPVFYAQLSLENLTKILSLEVPLYKAVPRFPAIQRDLSVVVFESVQAGRIAEDIQKLGKNLVVGVELFDLFRGGRVPAGSKNLAYRVIYQSPEKTLLAEDIQKLHADIAATIVKKYQASFQ